MLNYRIDNIKLFNKMKNDKHFNNFLASSECKVQNINYFINNKNCYEFLKNKRFKLSIDNTLFFVYLYIQAINYLLNKNKYDYIINIYTECKAYSLQKLYIEYIIDSNNKFNICFACTNNFENSIKTDVKIRDDKYIKIYNIVENIKSIYLKNYCYIFYDNYYKSSDDAFKLDNSNKLVAGYDKSFFDDKDNIKTLFINSIYKSAYKFILNTMQYKISIELNYFNKYAIEVGYLNIYNGFLGLKQVSAISPRDKKYLNVISYDVFEND